MDGEKAISRDALQQISTIYSLQQVAQCFTRSECAESVNQQRLVEVSEKQETQQQLLNW